MQGFAPNLAGIFGRGAFSPPPVGFLSKESPINTHCQTTKNSVLSNPKSTSIPGREGTATVQKQLWAQENNCYSSCVFKAFALWVYTGSLELCSEVRNRTTWATG